MEKTVNKGTAGASLIEIIISLVLVAIALMAISAVFPSINKNRKGIQEADQAKFIAAEVLEGLQYLTFNVNNDWCPATSLSVAEKEDCDAFVGRYTAPNNKVKVGIVEYTVTLSSPAATAWGKTVDVTVSWTKGGKTHNVKVTGAI